MTGSVKTSVDQLQDEVEVAKNLLAKTEGDLAGKKHEVVRFLLLFFICSFLLSLLFVHYFLVLKKNSFAFVLI